MERQVVFDDQEIMRVMARHAKSQGIIPKDAYITNVTIKSELATRSIKVTVNYKKV